MADWATRFDGSGLIGNAWDGDRHGGDCERGDPDLTYGSREGCIHSFDECESFGIGLGLDRVFCAADLDGFWLGHSVPFWSSFSFTRLL